MKVKVHSKSAVEATDGNNGKIMSLMIYFAVLDSQGNLLRQDTLGTICSKEDFERYQINEVYEIK